VTKLDGTKVIGVSLVIYMKTNNIYTKPTPNGCHPPLNSVKVFTIELTVPKQTHMVVFNHPRPKVKHPIRHFG
jgi:hypothetical protein